MRIYSLLISLLSIMSSFGQVGIKNDNPEADLDVNGSVRFRNLVNNGVTYNRIVLSNSVGDLGVKAIGENDFRVKDVFYAFMPDKVTTTQSNAALLGTGLSALIELGLDIEVEIEPNSVTAISLEYNVPVSAPVRNNDTRIPQYMGVTLVKNESNKNIELDEGSRKLTFFAINNTENIISMPVSGRATDIITNTTNTTKKITYSAKGFIENGLSQPKTFGNPGGSNSGFGNGIITVQVYNKKNN